MHITGSASPSIVPPQNSAVSASISPTRSGCELGSAAATCTSAAPPQAHIKWGAWAMWGLIAPQTSKSSPSMKTCGRPRRTAAWPSPQPAHEGGGNDRDRLRDNATAALLSVSVAAARGNGLSPCNAVRELRPRSSSSLWASFCGSVLLRTMSGDCVRPPGSM